MDKEFVTCDIALKFQKLGFEEDCFGWYNYDRFQLFGNDCLLDTYAGEEDRPLAPLWQQAVNWLIKHHGIYIELLVDGYGSDENVTNDNLCYRAFLWQVGKPKPHHNDDLGAGKYYQMLEISIKEAMKLI